LPKYNASAYKNTSYNGFMLDSPSRRMPPSLTKRLAPLYIAAFLQGFVLWYPIEKLFMRHIGFDDAGIGLMIAVYSTVMLVTATPTGILADRWSRKGLLIVATVLLALSSLIGGVSTGIPMYLLCASLWGIFFSMYQGTYDSIVYDTLAEDHHDPGLFDLAFGKVRIYDSLALVVGSLIGGAVAGAWGLRAPYFLTIPISLAAIAALVAFREPTLHRAGRPMAVIDQVRATLRAVLRNRTLVPVIVVMVLAAVLQNTMLEFATLWFLALNAPAAWFGLANAILLGAFAAGGWLARLTRRSGSVVSALAAGIVLGALVLTFTRNLVVVVAAELLVAAGAIALEIHYLGELHGALDSKVRAGASSAVDTMSRGLIIPMALVFGATSRAAGIFTAGWILVAASAGLGAVMLYVQAKRSRTPDSVTIVK
jgi:MFS family permease